MEESLLFGEYSKHTSKIFTEKDILDIKNSLLAGVQVKKIAKKYSVCSRVIDTIFKEFLLDKKNFYPSTQLGSKDEEYYTEEEMLSGIDYSSYTWDNLTEEEKQFYLNYGKQNNNRDDSSLE
jgi:hypothetical protein